MTKGPFLNFGIVFFTGMICWYMDSKGIDDWQWFFMVTSIICTCGGYFCGLVDGER